MPKLNPTRPSAAIRTKYQRRLEKLVDQMHGSLVYWLTARYRADGPEIAQDASPAMALRAADASPAMALRAAMRKLGRRWLNRFDDMAPKLAAYFATAVGDRSTRVLADTLRKGGFTVRFKPTRAMNEAYQAVVGENVALIKSIATKHLTDVEGAVMRSVAAGRDLGALTQELTEVYGVTKRRAAIIARTQNNAATAVMTRVRQHEAGITKARWLHSAGGKTPRPEHVAFSGKTYDVDKGAFLEGKWTWPGVEINCRCVSVPVIPGFDD